MNLADRAKRFLEEQRKKIENKNRLEGEKAAKEEERERLLEQLREEYNIESYKELLAELEKIKNQIEDLIGVEF